MNPVREDQGKKQFSADDLIDAYLKGKADQKSNDEKVLIQALDTNLKLAQNLSVSIFDLITDSNFKCNTVRLKIKDIYSFAAIFIVDANDYTSKDFRKIYESSINIKKEHNKDLFDFSTIFCPYNENFDTQKLIIDGFTYYYAID